MKIREEYQKFGSSDLFYIEKASEYKNPHQKIIESLLEDYIISKSKDSRILDLCCGDGLVTNYLKSIGFKNIYGVDPYFQEIYQQKTKEVCYKKDFKEIVLSNDLEECDIIICSFALHLCEKSLLPQLLFKLSQIGEELVVITPHKNPVIKNSWSMEREVMEERVRMRVFQR
jgi:2-polyprenyl-3-methyl-5-hydroxy-6-metoxy-1,4-benzoquinol methylase